MYNNSIIIFLINYKNEENIIVFVGFFILVSSSFAEFKINTNLPISKQNIIKSELEKFYKKFDEDYLLKMSSIEGQVLAIEKINKKIENILKQEKKEINIFILSYLKYLLSERLDNLDSLKNLQNSDIGVETILDSKSEKKTEEEKVLLNDMFQSYCRFGALLDLYSFSLDSNYYKSFIVNGDDDIEAQKIVDFVLLKQWKEFDLDYFIENLRKDKSGKYEDTIKLLLNIDNNLYNFFDKMKEVKNFKDFENNSLYFTDALKGFIDLPLAFSKEYKIDSKDLNDAGVLLVNGYMMCNNNLSVSYWEKLNER